MEKEKLNYEFSWGERHSVISTESWLRGYVFLRNIIANENKNVFMYVKSGQVATYNATKDLPYAIDSGEEILKHSFIKRHLSESKKVRKEFKSFYNKVVRTDLNKLKNDKLLKFFEEYQNLFDKTWAIFKVSQPEYLEKAKGRLEQLIRDNLNEDNSDEVFIVLTTPTEMDIIKEEEVFALELSFKQYTQKDILKYAKAYPWLFFNTYDRSITFKFLEEKINELKNIPAKDRKKRITEIKTKLKEHGKEQIGLLKELKNNKDIVYLSDVFCSLAIDRLKLKSWWGGAEYLFLNLFEEIAKRAEIFVEDLFMAYKIEDIINFLQNGIKLSKELLHDRENLYAVSLEDGKMKFYEKNETEEKFRTLIEPEKTTIENVSEFGGVVANIGIVKGMVKVISVEDLGRLLKDMDSFKQGDIMVTTMTQPTMVSLARRASAIITNEGGITSHAAILAREFKIPCIVGTKIATKVLKDGDLVEVDANKGIVKILERTS